MARSNQGGAQAKKDRFWYEITGWAGYGSFLTVSDALRFTGRFHIQITKYDVKTHRQTASAAAYMKAEDLWHIHRAAVLLADPRGFTFESFGGGFKDGQAESRVLRIAHDPGDKNQYADKPWLWTIKCGPGVTNSQGGFQPLKGAPLTGQGLFRLTDREMVMVVSEMHAYLNLRYNDLVQLRTDDQVERANKRAERMGGTPAYEPTTRGQGRTQGLTERGISRQQLPVQIGEYPRGTLLHHLDHKTLADLAANQRGGALATEAARLLAEQE